MAGNLALADQAAGTPHGFANPLLYSRLNGSSAVHDVVTQSSNRARLRRRDRSGHAFVDIHQQLEVSAFS